MTPEQITQTIKTQEEINKERSADAEERLTRVQEKIQKALDEELFLIQAELNTPQMKISLPIQLVDVKIYDDVIAQEAK